MNYNVPPNFQPGNSTLMRPGSSVGTPEFAGITSIPGHPGIGITIPFRPPGQPQMDLDPITPGRQTTPGIVTATGPSRIIVPGGNYPMPIGSVNSSGFMIGGNLSSLPRTQEIGVVSGPLRRIENHEIIQNEMIHRVEPIIIETTLQTDLNPPLPQTIIETGQPVVINQQTVITPVLTPPGVVLPVKQLSAVSTAGGIMNKGSCCNLKCWIWGLIGLILLGILIGGLFFAFRPRATLFDEHDGHSGLNYDRNIGPLPCQNGQLNIDGKCIKCPQGTIWNGTECILPNNFAASKQIFSSRNTHPEYFSSNYSPNDPNSQYKRVQSINTSWNSGNPPNGDPLSGYSAGSTSKIINSVAQVKKIIVPPLVQDPIRHLRIKN